MGKKLYMSKDELNKISCTDDEIREWKALAKQRKWKWGDEKFIQMMRHMKYLRGVLKYNHPCCESPPELIAYDAARRFGVSPHVQFIINQYRADQFYYLDGILAEDSMLVVEIDGSYSHTSAQDRITDEQKTKDLNNDGIKVLRFTGSQVFKDPDKVGQGIVDYIKNLDKEAQDKLWDDIRNFNNL